MTRQERQEFRKILHAHEQTVDVCEACATTTRELAAEVARGGAPARDDLVRTIEEAELVLRDLSAVREELRRLTAALG